MALNFFGTDGIRGRANSAPIIPENLIKIGRAIALYFQKQLSSPLSGESFFPYKKHLHNANQLTVVIGKDTRLSGYMIENALAAGLTSQGANVIFLGPLPTPAVSMLIRSLRADIGIVISASHNPYYDNGIKFFDHQGVKFNTQTEIGIERIIQQELSQYSSCSISQGSGETTPHQILEECGGAVRLDDAAGRYVEFTKATFPKNQNLNGMKIVLDCANGAAYKVAPQVFWELGASVIPLGVQPNGRNINQDCGALYPQLLQEKVVNMQASVGIALDGDADRLVLVTPKGHIINGDQILALIALHWQNKGLLSGGVVSTCMSNLGLKLFLEDKQIPHFESAVGDKNVFNKMQEKHCTLGGEESGHIILGDLTSTGDGIIAALQVLSIVQEQRKTLDQLFPVFKELPKKTCNFELPKNYTQKDVDHLSHISKHWIDAKGTIVVRKSGTEPVLRVMAQHEDSHQVSSFFKTFIAETQLRLKK